MSKARLVITAVVLEGHRAAEVIAQYGVSKSWLWYLAHHHRMTVSVATIARILTREGLITPAPKKRPKAAYIRFQAAMPNETWQSDFTHYRLTDGRDVEIITWLDDHSRYVLHCSAHIPRSPPRSCSRPSAPPSPPTASRPRH